MVVVYILFMLLLLPDTKRVHLVFAQAQLEVQVQGLDVVNASWGSPRLLGMGATGKCARPPFFRQTIMGTFCIMLRGGMKPPGQRPLKCSLLPVPPLPHFTGPHLLPGITLQDQVPALLQEEAKKEGTRLGASRYWFRWPQQEKINAKR